MDNFKVWHILQEVMQEFQTVYNWISSYSCAQDGQGAWWAFIQHYQGESMVENIVTTSNIHVLQLRYMGERPRFMFDHYVSLYQKYHNDIMNAQPACTWDGWQHMWQLTDGISALNMSAAVAMIKATPTM